MTRSILSSAIAALLLLAHAAVGAPSARAAVTCSFDPVTAVARVDMGEDDDWAIVARERGGSAILVNGRPCEDATVRTTDRIRVVGGPGLQMLTIDLSGGPLGPGRTSEGTRVSEIEISFEGGTGHDIVHLQGGPGADRIGLGGAGAALGDDSDTDVWWWSVEEHAAYGGPGPDRLRSMWSRGVDLWGDGGDDVLIGYVGRDRLGGGGGDDLLAGSDGADRLDAGPGADRVRAGDGDDRLFLEDGQAETRINCGPGIDETYTFDSEDVEIATGCEVYAVEG